MARLWLPVSADDAIRAEAKTRRVVETGGPVFGYFDEGSRDCVVVIACGPGPKARHRPRSLSPDRDATHAAIHEMHARSAGVLSYLGDWHSHPGGHERPSGRDLDSLAVIADDSAVDVPEPVMVIVPTVVLTRRVRVRTVAAYRWNACPRVAERLDVNVTAEVEMDLPPAAEPAAVAASSPCTGP